MAILISILLLFFPLIYSVFLPISPSIFMRFLVGQLCFWSINAAAAFFFRFLSIPFNISTLCVVHSAIGFLMWRYLNENRKTPRWGPADSVSFGVMGFSGICFLIGSTGFNGALAVLSFSWDMAVHYLITSNITNTFAIMIPSYPFGFHVNASAVMQILLTPFGQLTHAILRTSVYSFFITYSLSCLCGVFAYLTVKHLLVQMRKTNNIVIEMFVSVCSSFFLISLVIIPVLWQGFISTLFMLLVLFSFIAFEDEGKANSKVHTLILGFTVFLLGVSYSYLSPVFLIYHIVQYVRTKEKRYIIFLLIQCIPLTDVLLSATKQVRVPTEMLSLWGWFVPFPHSLIICMVIGSCAYLFYRMKNHSYCITSPLIFLVLFSLFSLGIVSLENKTSYSFYKSFVPVMGLLVLYTSKAGNVFIVSLRSKYGTSTVTKILVYGGYLICMYYIFLPQLAMGGLPGINQVILGRLRFFENSPEIFHIYKRAWEKNNIYDALIIFDPSLNRLQWWVAYFGNKTPVQNRIHSQYRQRQDLDYYAEWIKTMPAKNRLLIVDPYLSLVHSCRRDVIEMAVSKKKKIDFLIPIPWDVYRMKCGN